ARTARHGTPDPSRRHRDGAQARAWRSHRRPSAVGELDALHLQSSVDAEDGPAVDRKRRQHRVGQRPQCPLLTQSGHEPLRICCRATRPLNPISPVVNPCCNHMVGVVLSLEEGDATTRFHQRNCWFSDRLAARAASAAGRADTAHRYAGNNISEAERGELRRLPRGNECTRIRRGEQHCHRIPIGGWRWEPGSAIVADLLRAKVDVIVTRGAPATLAAKAATTSIPIVMAAIGDPFVVVASLSHPGSNITGLSGYGADLEAKRVELLKELIPGARR